MREGEIMVPFPSFTGADDITQGQLRTQCARAAAHVVPEADRVREGVVIN
jgi:hypothetical protein